MNLRDFQLKACGAARVAWHEGHKRVLLVLATGLGKTEIIVSIADRWTKGRVLVVAPRVDLVDQTAKKLYKRTGEWPGIEQAHHRSDEHGHFRPRFVVASQQTLAGGRYARLRDIGLVVIDEAHLALTENVQEMLDWYIARGALALGVTATPKRGDNKAMGQIWQCCPFTMDIAMGISEGWLAPVRAQCVQLKSLDLSVIKPTGQRDFSENKLAEVMGQDRVIYEVADVTARESVGLKTAVFCTHVHDARAVAHLLADQYGLRADWIAGDRRLCTTERRRDVLQSFTQDPDGVQIVCNVGVLTTGWDFPGLQHIVNARPTMSLALFTQIFGRGTRPLEGIVDFEGSTAETRRLAIAQSAKPYFKLTDLRDVALQHRLISVVDVLGGSLGLVARKNANDALSDGSGPRDVDQALLEAQRRAEEQLAEEERRKRNRMAARAEYSTVDVDPFNPYTRAKGGKKDEDRGPVFPFGKYRRRPIKFVRSDYLRWWLGNVQRRPKIEWVFTAIEAELEKRRAQSPVRGERFG